MVAWCSSAVLDGSSLAVAVVTLVVTLPLLKLW